MNLFYYKQDNTIWGCGDEDCCGDDYEEFEGTFVWSDEPMTADEFIDEFGGGEVVEIRPATDSEIEAYEDGRHSAFSSAISEGLYTEFTPLQSGKVTTDETPKRLKESDEMAKKTEDDKLQDEPDYLQGMIDSYSVVIDEIDKAHDALNWQFDMIENSVGVYAKKESRDIVCGQLNLILTLRSKVEEAYFEKLDSYRRKQDAQRAIKEMNEL